MAVELLIQLSASLLTIVASWFYGNKSPWGPWIGIASQVPWSIIMIHGGLWGLAPLNVVQLIIHTRNLIKWRNDGIQQSDAVNTASLQEHHGE